MTPKILPMALTFDDVLLVPEHSEVLPHAVDLRTKLSNEIDLSIPLISAAMDTVTEARLAIALAQQGGIGIIHKNMSIEAQAQQVRQVKRFKSGIVRDPITITPNVSIKELLDITEANNFSGVPVVMGDTLVGIVTNRDVRFETNMALPVSAVMTPKEKLVTVKEEAERDEVIQLLHKHRIEKILVVNDDYQLRGLITVKDILSSQDQPFACKDADERLRVGAAVGVGGDTMERLAALIAARVDAIIIDTAHGHSQGVIEQLRWVKQRYPQVPIIAGNIATAKAALALVDAGADAVKVGIGPGSICTTRIVTGAGVPQISALMEVATALKGRQIPIIADGGIRFSGDIAKAIAAGADAVMVGGLLAGTEESPGEIELYQGRTYKNYRGMGSLGAMSQRYSSKDRYFQGNQTNQEKLVPEGIEGRVPYKGSLISIVQQLMGGLRASMGYTGCCTIAEMKNKTQFVQVTQAGMRESHVHDVGITKQAPNYQIEEM